MIPKIIHYCWFGGNPLPASAIKCIKSWKKHCKGYQIIEWNETNFDLSSTPLYVRQAYEAQKWSFVTDYIRLKVVYDNGGLYFDTDVEVIKPFDELLTNKAFFGFEDNTYVNTGLGFGAEKGLKILFDIMKQYQDIGFLKADGAFDTTSCPVRNTEVFLRYGLIQNGQNQRIKDDIVIYSPDYFCPKSFYDGIIRKTDNTHSIHHFDSSWQTKESIEWTRNFWKRKQKRAKQKNRKRLFKAIIFGMIGEKNYYKLRKR